MRRCKSLSELQTQETEAARRARCCDCPYHHPMENEAGQGLISATVVEIDPIADKKMQELFKTYEFELALKLEGLSEKGKCEFTKLLFVYVNERSGNGGRKKGEDKKGLLKNHKHKCELCESESSSSSESEVEPEPEKEKASPDSDSKADSDELPAESGGAATAAAAALHQLSGINTALTLDKAVFMGALDLVYPNLGFGESADPAKNSDGSSSVLDSAALHQRSQRHFTLNRLHKLLKKDGKDSNHIRVLAREKFGKMLEAQADDAGEGDEVTAKKNFTIALGAILKDFMTAENNKVLEEELELSDREKLERYAKRNHMKTELALFDYLHGKVDELVKAEAEAEAEAAEEREKALEAAEVAEEREKKAEVKEGDKAEAAKEADKAEAPEVKEADQADEAPEKKNEPLGPPAIKRRRRQRQMTRSRK